MSARFLTFALLLFTVACAPAQAATVAPTASSTPAPTASATATPFPTAIPFTPTPTSTATPLPPPTVTASPTPIPETVILFTGDINPARCVYYYAQQANDMAAPYRAMGELLQSADIAVGSLDASISDINPPTPCIETTRNLLAPSSVVTGLAWAGFDLITVATNHIKDCGLIRGCTNESMLDSMAHLRAAGIVPVGAGRNLTEAVAPAIFTVNGVRFAFLGFTAVNAPTWATLTEPGTMPSTKAVVVEAIQRAQQQADVVIVLPQWGREFKNEISLDQWTSAGAMVDAGAILVVGNNPHRVQAVETFANGAVVAYALGNFVFDQQWTDGTLYTVQGMVLQATFRGTELSNIELIPIHIHDNFQPRLAAPTEAAQILQEVELSGLSVPKR